MNIDLTGKYALVTGAGRVIGKACAIELANVGAKIVINDLEESSDLESTKNFILKQGFSCEAITADVSTRFGCLKIIEEIKKKMIHLDILISNPAMNIREDFLKHSPEDFEKIIQSTLISGFHISQLVSRQMVSSQIQGKIVFFPVFRQKCPLQKTLLMVAQNRFESFGQNDCC